MMKIPDDIIGDAIEEADAALRSATGLASGGRMPAEWEAHARCFMAWPGNALAWGQDLAKVQRDYVSVAHAIRQFEPVTMIVGPEEESRARRSLGADVEIIVLPTNEAWLRDSGPSFVKRPDGGLAGIAWRFNGWGGASPDYRPDALLARRLLANLKLPVVSSALAMEGGALHVDGAGTLLTTETVVFAKNRNPGLTHTAAEAEFARALGIEKTIWLPGDPYEKGTDGHIDGIACFVRPGAVLFETSADSDSAHRAVCERNRRALEDQTDACGRTLEVLTLQGAPDLGRGSSDDWGYASSYVNFYIANGGVVMPKFGIAEDNAAFETVSSTFPDRKVVQVDISTLAAGGGGIHCITQQMPL